MTPWRAIAVVVALLALPGCSTYRAQRGASVAYAAIEEIQAFDRVVVPAVGRVGQPIDITVEQLFPSTRRTLYALVPEVDEASRVLTLTGYVVVRNVWEEAYRLDIRHAAFKPASRGTYVVRTRAGRTDLGGDAVTYLAPTREVELPIRVE